MKTNLISISGRSKSGKDTVAKMIQYLDYKKHNDDLHLTFEELNKSGGVFTPKGTRSLVCVYNKSNWEIKKFAYKVKQIASLLTGIPVEDFEKQEVKDSVLGKEWWYHNTEIDKIPYSEYPDSSIPWYGANNICRPTIRELLQKIGTDAMRDQIHPNIWINALFADYRCGGWDDGYKWMDCACEKGECDYSNRYTPKWIITDLRFPNEAKAIKDRGGIVIRVNRPLHQVYPDYYFQFELDGTMGRYDFKDFLIEEKGINFDHPSETALDNYKDWDYTIDNSGTLEELLTKVEIFYEQQI